MAGVGLLAKYALTIAAVSTGTVVVVVTLLVGNFPVRIDPAALIALANQLGI